MATLIRPWRTFYEIPATGRRVPKGTPGAKKVQTRQSKWYGQGIPGLPPKKRVPLAADKMAAQRLLDDIVRRAERGHAGLPDAAAARTPLAALLAEFEADLSLGLASKNRRQTRPPSAAQVALVVQRVRDVLAGCGFARPADLGAGAPAKLARYLQTRAATEKAGGGVSQQTAAYLLAAARRFCRWLATRGVPVRADLFDAVPGFDFRNNRVHPRREVWPDELARLLDAARASPRRIRKLTGEDRYHLYLTAFATGYRAGELAALVPESFALDGPVPTCALPGKLNKNKKAAAQPLPPGVAAQLRGYLAAKPARRPVWPGTWADAPVKVLRADLKAAGVPYRVETPAGPQFADFHALRHTYVSALHAAGVHGRDLQDLARHADPGLTQGTYTHTRPEVLAAMVGRLAIPGTAGTGPAPSLAGLTRPQLEELAVGLLGALDAILGGLDAPRDAPAAATPGDMGRQKREIG